MNHYAKAPWRNGVGQIEDADGGCIAQGVNEADAMRIVACVNACEGCPTGTLEYVGQEEYNAARRLILSQRDKLMSVLEFILRGMDEGHIRCAPYFDFDPNAAQAELKHPADMIREAIAEVKAKE